MAIIKRVEWKKIQADPELSLISFVFLRFLRD